ncbi:MAG: GPR endopeptidase [Bacilli bacterium]|nr:GPR endopeptidase [Bacilli bacterium]
MIKISHEIDLKNKCIRTDLAIELTDNKARIDDGNIKITDIKLSKKEAEKIGKKEGTYITIEYSDITDYENREKVKTVFVEELKKMIKKVEFKDEDICLIIGLGNEKSTPDSLGPLVIEKTLVTNHLYMYDSLEEGYKRVCKISPGVTGETGIETSDLIKETVNTIKPKLVIVIDALAASSIDRVNKTIQMTNAGINPGSGIGNKRKEISKESLKVPVIAVGVPTVVDAASIVNDTISYMYSHFSYQKTNYNNPKNKLMTNVNYLKYKSDKIDKADRQNLFGLLGTLSEEDTKKLIYEILNPIGYNLMVTPKEEDFIVQKLSELISEGINLTLHKKMSS